MAMRKRYSTKRKSVVRRRRVNRKRPARSGVIRLIRRCAEQNIYNTATTAVAAASGSVVTIGTPYQTPPFAGSTYYNIPFSIDTQLLDILGYTEFTAIADKYKINWVKVRVFATSNTASAGGTSQLPSILWSEDGDDAVVPASTTTGLQALREKMNSKYRQFKQNGSAISMFYKPMIAVGVGNSSGGTSNAQVKSAPFIDCNNVDIPHYGVKGYLQDVNLASTASVYTQFKFDVLMSVTLKDIQ